eukprot:TRINITY_DN9405_c0_g1_i1.p1 TRINITY_DN9405_c0_g1~~TRINITY_DN9405_c0_g1_i1.p1  ORF type:complete len:707 (+),score=136.33 TRINITY_DN9405_c0_g1_i1:385-2505(+)
MPPRQSASIWIMTKGKGGRFRCKRCILGLFVFCVIVPTCFITTRARSSVASSTSVLRDGSRGQNKAVDEMQRVDWKRHSSIEHVIDAIEANSQDLGPWKIGGRKDSPSLSWVFEKPSEMNKHVVTYYEKQDTSGDKLGNLHSDEQAVGTSEDGKSNKEQNSSHAYEAPRKMEEENEQLNANPAGLLRRQLRQKRRQRRSMELIQQDDEEKVKLENAAIERSKEVDSAVLGKYSIWRKENENENSDSNVRLIRDQLIMARVYSSIARARNSPEMYNELMLRIKESQRALGEASQDSDLHHSAPEKIKVMGQTLTKAREKFYDCAIVTKKLRAMLQSADEQVRTLKKQSTFLSQLAAKTVPKGLHCLSMRLTIEYYLLPLEKRKFPNQEKLEDPTLYHYALFSDNVLAASVVVNSTIMNARDPEKHVFHLVTDKLNFGAMNMWFLLNPPGKATITVENVDEFKWLNSSYCPVLRQLESAAMKEYYFRAHHATTLSAGSSNLKYRNPKYLSMLNHLRFYLPQVYPKLDKILFLDDDIVVQKDLTPLWSVDLKGKVNGAVETCGESFHRFDKYLNFSNPHIAKHFDPNACGWAYGMNVFDLKEWKKRDITGIYHKWQNMNEDRVLWKLGTLPPGLITFYGLTHPLDKHWHVLGLGYNPSVDRAEIENAAVVHYNGNMKPWLELAMTKYRSYWTKYIKYDHPYLQQCNINE